MNCTRCGGSLQVGMIKCPKCAMPVPPLSLTAPNKTQYIPAIQYPAVEAPQSAQSPKSFARITMGSGAIYKVHHILLFDQRAIEDANLLKTQAMSRLDGFSTGVGFIGNPGYVLSSSVMLGAFESMVSNNLQKQGLEMLSKAEHLLANSRGHSEFIPVSEIKNNELAIPDLWYSERILSDHLKHGFIHNGDPMVIVNTDTNKMISLMWHHVESYEIVSLS